MLASTPLNLITHIAYILHISCFISSLHFTHFYTHSMQILSINFYMHPTWILDLISRRDLYRQQKLTLARLSFKHRFLFFFHFSSTSLPILFLSSFLFSSLIFSSLLLFSFLSPSLIFLFLLVYFNLPTNSTKNLRKPFASIPSKLRPNSTTKSSDNPISPK